MQEGSKNIRVTNWKEWLVLAVGLVMAVRIGVNIVRLYGLGSQLKEAEIQLAAEKQKNDQLKQRLAEAQTPEYMEKEVRERLGYGLEGETVVIIPEEVLPDYRPTGEVNVADEPNWKKWWNRYFGG